VHDARDMLQNTLTSFDMLQNTPAVVFSERAAAA
jgi:hypothetical protein